MYCAKYFCLTKSVFFILHYINISKRFWPIYIFFTFKGQQTSANVHPNSNIHPPIFPFLPTANQVGDLYRIGVRIVIGNNAEGIVILSGEVFRLKYTLSSKKALLMFSHTHDR